MSAVDPIGGLRSAERRDGELHLVLNNTLDAVEAGRLELLGLLDGQSPKVINRIEVIFEELVSNAIRHGFKAGGDHCLQIWARVEPGSIAIDFEDDGEPFDPFTEPDPDAFTTLEDARIGGLGIPLVRRLSTSATYDYAVPRAPWRDGRERVNRTSITVAAT